MFAESGVALVLWVLASGWPQQRPVSDAVALGTSQEVGPYDLREHTHVSGVIYTQFVRVAMASRAALLRGSTLDPSVLERLAEDSSVYVVMHWTQLDEQRARDAAGGSDLPLRVGIMPGSYPPVRPGLVEPLWVTRDISVLEQFGAPLPFSDGLVIAAFPREVLKAGSVVMAYVRLQEGPLRVGPYASVRAGMITEKDVATWR